MQHLKKQLDRQETQYAKLMDKIVIKTDKPISADDVKSLKEMNRKQRRTKLAKVRKSK